MDSRTSMQVSTAHIQKKLGVSGSLKDSLTEKSSGEGRKPSSSPIVHHQDGAQITEYQSGPILGEIIYANKMTVKVYRTGKEVVEYPRCEDPEAILKKVTKKNGKIITTLQNGKKSVILPFRQSGLLPIKTRRANKYKVISENDSKSFHSVDRVVKATAGQMDISIKLAYLKYNPDNWLMSVLEPFAAAVCNFLAGDRIPKARPIVNEKKDYVGVTSDALENFEPVFKRPLTLDDLDIDVLRRAEVTVAELDELDELLRKEGLDLKKLPPHQIITRSLGHRTLNVSVKDLIKARNMKGSGISWTTVYLTENDDPHTQNASWEDGRQIDCDMCFWPIFYFFKKLNLFDRWLRHPAVRKNDAISANDIAEFPDLKDAQPFYWPTLPPVGGEMLRSMLRVFCEVSKNAYNAKDNEIYKQLKTHPIFVYHKFSTLLKFILTTPDMYRKLAEQYIPKDFVIRGSENPEFNGKKLIDIIVDHIDERIRQFKNVLLSMEEFNTFIKNHGDTVFAKIANEFALKKEDLEAKIIRKKAEYEDAVKQQKADLIKQEPVLIKKGSPEQIMEEFEVEDDEDDDFHYVEKEEEKVEENDGFLFIHDESDHLPKETPDEILAKQRAYEEYLATLNLDRIRGEFEAIKAIVSEDYAIIAHEDDKQVLNKLFTTDFDPGASVVIRAN